MSIEMFKRIKSNEEPFSEGLLLDEHIPQEVLLRILSFLPLLEVLNVKSVCKKWNILTEDNHFWKGLIGRHFPKCQCIAREGIENSKSIFIRSYRKKIFNLNFSHSSFKSTKIEEDNYFSFSVSHKGKYLFVGYQNGLTKVLDRGTGELIQRICFRNNPNENEYSVFKLMPGKNENELYIVYDNGIIEKRDMNHPELVVQEIDLSRLVCQERQLEEFSLEDIYLSNNFVLLRISKYPHLFLLDLVSLSLNDIALSENLDDLTYFQCMLHQDRAIFVIKDTAALRGEMRIWDLKNKKEIEIKNNSVSVLAEIKLIPRDKETFILFRGGVLQVFDLNGRLIMQDPENPMYELWSYDSLMLLNKNNLLCKLGNNNFFTSYNMGESKDFLHLYSNNLIYHAINKGQNAEYLVSPYCNNIIYFSDKIEILNKTSHAEILEEGSFDEKIMVADFLLTLMHDPERNARFKEKMSPDLYKSLEEMRSAREVFGPQFGESKRGLTFIVSMYNDKKQLVKDLNGDNFEAQKNALLEIQEILNTISPRMMLDMQKIYKDFFKKIRVFIKLCEEVPSILRADKEIMPKILLESDR